MVQCFPCTLHTAHCTLHTAHCTLHTAHCTLHTAHCTLHTAHCTLHTHTILAPCRTTCEGVMRVLRQNKDSVMAMLEAFVHDPLINWRLLNTTEAATEAALARESDGGQAAGAHPPGVPRVVSSPSKCWCGASVQYAQCILRVRGHSAACASAQRLMLTFSCGCPAAATTAAGPPGPMDAAHHPGAAAAQAAITAAAGSAGGIGMPSPPRRDARERELREALGALGDANEVRAWLCARAV